MMSKEKFVRDKPHVNIGLMIGLFIIGFAAAGAMTYLYPDSILPAYVLLSSGASSLRDSSLHITRILLNGGIYGIGLLLVGEVVMKGKKILQN
jgi:hypothetical protein